MDLLAQAVEGFRSVEADPAVKEQAARFLRRWLSEPEFAAYRPQLEWLIRQQKWAGLLDRFYQILPFGTGGRRGAVGIGPNRMNLWTLAASVQGHCEYLRERFPEAGRLLVVLAYDVRQFEDRGKNTTTPSCPTPSCTCRRRGWPTTPPASTSPTASTSPSRRPTARASWPRPSCPSPSDSSTPTGG
jgi:phosphoglucomutase